MDMIEQNSQMIAVSLVALAVFGTTIALAWPFLIPREAGRRLREQIEGTRGERRRKPADAAPAQPQKAELQSRPSEMLDRLVSTFKSSEHTNDSKVAALLQQAGFRGRAAVIKYTAVRIICPVLFFVFAGFYALFLLPGSQSIAIQLAVILGATALGYFLPPLMLKNRIDKRKLEIGRAWPDAVDLLLICVETGMSIEHAFKKVAEEMGSTSIELAKELSLTNAELSYLQERRQAYENMAKRIDLDAVQAVTSCLIQSEKYGTSLGVSLRVLAQESREMRMTAAEKKAAALPPKLTVPMIVFFLPVLFAVIITPAALQIAST